MQVTGCSSGPHSNTKPEQPDVLGGCDVRSGNDGSTEAQERLKTVAEFNEERRLMQGGGAGDAISKMYQLRQAMDKSGVSGEVFDRAKEAVSAKLAGDHVAVNAELARRLEALLKAIAAE
mmetsp:Transcript_38989/g.87197  ORF Transcript_38989/g.87197 Transcript_38989/m.87197 type:complete len:120 (+) Transcript_38989:798-1157(+)